MTRLTEEMVVSRAKQSDLGLIKKLNCWGSDLSDVSILKRMRNVEVLALSVNRIGSLQAFENCLNLRELYLRKNNVSDLNELAHLQNLPNLQELWLDENPLCEQLGTNYRAIILRTLPNIKKLDNIEVTPEEVEAALKSRNGVDFRQCSGNEDDNEEDAYDNQQYYAQQQHPKQNELHQQQQQQQHQQHQHQQQQQQQRHLYQALPSSRRSSSPLKEVKEEESPELQQQQQQQQQPSPTNTDESISNLNSKSNNCSNASTPTQRSPDTDQEYSSGIGGVSSSCGGYEYRERIQIPPSMSTHSMKEYHQTERPSYHGHYRHSSQTDLTDWNDQGQQQQQTSQHSQYGGSNATLNKVLAGRRNICRNDGNREVVTDWEEERPKPQRRCEGGRYGEVSSTVSPAVLNHYANFHRRPINRSSNLLSATLCLVKELDYSSLEVVEHAIRCRIDELSSD